MKKPEEKYLKYAVVLTAKIAELFDEHSEGGYHIDMKELQEDNNLTDFFHVLANVMPCNLFNKITGGFQYSHKPDNK